VATNNDADEFAHLPYDLADASAFVREVLLPGGSTLSPRIASETARFALEIRDSPIHRHGVFAAEAISANERVIEYTGERISYNEGVRRRVRPHLYLFWLSPGWLIDGAVGGGGAEFVNHSCEPNVAADVCEGRVFFRSLRDITAGEELFFDYKVRGDAPPMPCHCGAVTCRGFLNEP
jgi:uncharacterized protein